MKRAYLVLAMLVLAAIGYCWHAIGLWPSARRAEQCVPGDTEALPVVPERQTAFAVWTTDSEARRVGSGFFLSLPDSTIIGVTAGHALADVRFATLCFRHPNTGEKVATFSRVAAPISDWRHGSFADDYLLLRPDTAPTEALWR